jgi:hypothetical protein
VPTGLGALSVALKLVLSREWSLIGHRALLPGLLHGFAIVVLPEPADEDPGEFTMTESSHKALSRSISCRTACGTRFLLSDQHLNIIGEQSQHAPLSKPPS